MFKVTKLVGPDTRLVGTPQSRCAGLVEAGACAYVETRLAGSLGLGDLENAPYHGSLEAWFDDFETATAFVDGLDHSDLWEAETPEPSALLVTQPHVVLGDPGAEPVSDGLKGIFVFRRRPGMPIADFQTRWLDGHGPIAARTPKTSRYVQCHVAPSQYAGDAEPSFDGITELYWDTLEDAGFAMASDSMTVEQSADAPHFVDGGSVKLAIVGSQRLL